MRKSMLIRCIESELVDLGWGGQILDQWNVCQVDTKSHAGSQYFIVRIRFNSLHSATTEQSVNAHKKTRTKKKNEERTQVFNVENPNVGKTTAVHKLQNTLYVRGIQQWKRKGNDL